MTSATQSITAQNTWTDSVCPYFEGGAVNYSISGTWSATVTIQRSFDDGSTWFEVTTFTSNDQGLIDDDNKNVIYRIGVATGDFTSGTVVVGLYW